VTFEELTPIDYLTTSDEPLGRAGRGLVSMGTSQEISSEPY
jgi:hypothetical protein